MLADYVWGTKRNSVDKIPYYYIVYPIQDPKTLLKTGLGRTYILFEKKDLTKEDKVFIQSNSRMIYLSSFHGFDFVVLSRVYACEVSDDQFTSILNYIHEHKRN